MYSEQENASEEAPYGVNKDCQRARFHRAASHVHHSIFSRPFPIAHPLYISESRTYCRRGMSLFPGGWKLEGLAYP